MFRKDKTPLPLPPQRTPRDVTDFPTGTVIETVNGDFFYIKGKRKFRIISDRILFSWSFPRTVYVTQTCADRYKTFGRLGFREGTVIRDITTSAIYLISENKKRLITTPDALENLGVSVDDIMFVSPEEAGIHEGGEDI
jgi:hypothetical protein